MWFCYGPGRLLSRHRFAMQHARLGVVLEPVWLLGTRRCGGAKYRRAEKSRKSRHAVLRGSRQAGAPRTASSHRAAGNRDATAHPKLLHLAPRWWRTRGRLCRGSQLFRGNRLLARLQECEEALGKNRPHFASASRQQECLPRDREDSGTTTQPLHQGSLRHTGQEETLRIVRTQEGETEVLECWPIPRGQGRAFVDKCLPRGLREEDDLPDSQPPSEGAHSRGMDEAGGSGLRL